MKAISLLLSLLLCLPAIQGQQTVTVRRRAVSGGGSATITGLGCQQQNTGTTGNFVLTGVNTTGTNTLVLGVAYINSAGIISSISHSADVTNATIVTGGTTSGGPSAAFYAWNSPTTSSSDVITIHNSASPGLFVSVCIFSISGTTGTFSTNATGNVCAPNTSPCAGNAISPSGSNQALISCFGTYPPSGTPSVNSSFTGLQSTTGSAGFAYAIACAGLVQATGASVTPTWTRTNGAANPSVITAAWH